MSFINEIHYFRIPVINLEDSVSWYTNCLGLKVRRKNVDDLVVIELPEGPLLILVKADEESRGHFIKEGKAEFSIGFTCPEIYKFHEYLILQEVRVEEIQEDQGHYYFYFYDPSGNKLQVHW